MTIDRYLRGAAQTEPFRIVKSRRRVEFAETGEMPENFKRPHEQLRPPSERIGDFEEADATFTEMTGVCESKRCLRCDLD